MMIPRYTSPACIAVAGFLLAGCAVPSSPTAGETSPSSPTPSPEQSSAAAESSLSADDRIAAAETAVREELPDTPIWMGMTFQCTIVDDTDVCVDRTWAPGGGPSDTGGPAGYVVVSFPDVDPGEPQDGTCAEYAPAAAPADVQVPPEVAGDPGLLISTDFGDEWRLTVPYAVVKRELITAGDRKLQVATVETPDGRVYAANGTAKDHGKYNDLEPIWAEDPEVEGLKVTMRPVLDEALRLCD